MKIGIDARFVGPEGTGLGKYTEKLIENLQKIDSVNEYVIFLRQSNWSYLNLKNKNFQKKLADVPWYSAEEQLKMPAIYMSQNLDLLHVPHFNVPFLYRKKFIVTIHDLIHHHFSQESTTTRNPLMFKIKRLGYKSTIANAIKRSQKIIVPSNFVKNEIISTFKIDSQKVVVTYEAAEEEYFQKSKVKIHFSQENLLKASKSKHDQLLYVGNAYPHKNLNKLLNAMMFLDLKLTIVSPRNVFSKRLEHEVKNRSLDEKVKITPYQEPSELVKILRSSEAYVFPSLAEGFGIPGLNAMAAGIPVVAANIPTLKEIYGDAAVYFDPQDANDIAEKIKSVTLSSKKAEDLIKKGFYQAKKYSWLKMAKETLAVYNSLK